MFALFKVIVSSCILRYSVVLTLTVSNNESVCLNNKKRLSIFTALEPIFGQLLTTDLRNIEEKVFKILVKQDFKYKHEVRKDISGIISSSRKKYNVCQQDVKTQNDAIHKHLGHS